MHICMLTSHYPVVSETFISEPVKWFEARGHRVTVITRIPGERPATFAAADGAWPAPAVHLSRARRARSLLTAPLKTLEMLPEVRRWHRAHWLDSLTRAVDSTLKTADVLLAQAGTEGVGWMPAAAAARRPMSVYFHGWDATARVKDDPHFYDALFASGVGIITNGNYLRGRLVELGARPERISIVPYGANPEIAETPRRPDVSPRRLLTIARLVAKKGIDDALRAFARLSASEPWVFDIIGDGPLRGDLEGLASSLGITDRVRFLGQGSRAAVRDGLARASVFVLASKTASSNDTEGTPVSIIEAATMGCPVLSTQHAGIPELLPPSAKDEGYIVPEGDVGALARALERLAGSQEERDRWGSACRDFAHERYSAQAHVNGVVTALEANARIPARPAS